MIQSYHWQYKQDSYHGGDNDADERVDARGREIIYVFVIRLGAEFRGTKDILFGVTPASVSLHEDSQERPYANQTAVDFL